MGVLMMILCGPVWKPQSMRFDAPARYFADQVAAGACAAAIL